METSLLPQGMRLWIKYWKTNLLIDMKLRQDFREEARTGHGVSLSRYRVVYGGREEADPAGARERSTKRSFNLASLSF